MIDKNKGIVLRDNKIVEEKSSSTFFDISPQQDQSIEEIRKNAIEPEKEKPIPNIPPQSDWTTRNSWRQQSIFMNSDGMIIDPWDIPIPRYIFSEQEINRVASRYIKNPSIHHIPGPKRQVSFSMKKEGKPSGTLVGINEAIKRIFDEVDIEKELENNSFKKEYLGVEEKPELEDVFTKSKNKSDKKDIIAKE